ncbi:DUF5722 domain-containing protein [Haloferula chungangensis]|uniref:DUF5722 domain-containing protein n=1 Tax=Haloferula chungangensis TaxID=1048331 RepID=A0ABW2L389_9BACT
MFLRLLIGCFLVLQLGAETPLSITQANGSPGSLKPSGDGSYELQTGGGISLYANLTAKTPAGPLVLEFEYFCLGEVPRFALIPGPPFDNKAARWSQPLGHSEAWTPHRIRLSAHDQPLPANWKQLRLDLPIKQDTTLRLRNLRLRRERPGEFSRSKSSAAETTATLRTYFDTAFPARINSVRVTSEQVILQGNVGKLRGPIAIAELPIHKLLSDPNRFVDTSPIKAAEDGSFSLTIPRLIQRNGREQDRLTSRWQVVATSGARPEPRSHARFPDEVICRSSELPPAKPKSKKGLGGWSADRGPKAELEALDIASVTVNVRLEQLLSSTPSKGSFPVAWQDRTFHANPRALEKYDATFREAAKGGRMVSAILLIANPARSNSPTVQTLGHPDAVAEGTYAMPNVTSKEGIELYGAILNLMAERWTRPDGKFGRVHHWIVHNEVDAGWTWTNCGEKELLPFVDLYHRSLRMVHLITRQYDPHTRPFVSLTHHWAKTANPKFHPSRDILETLALFTTAEGDFPWALAHHPYPSSLRKPRTWEDKDATDSFDTPKITPKNIEVLDRWMRTPAMRYRGTEVRPIHLSENGFNSPDYSRKSLEDQAAGMAYAWKKIAPLDSIEAWHYHNWIDNRKEGGLRIGLRKFPDAQGDPYGKKPIWHLYQALATPREDELIAPYLQHASE